jgi:hypothetical protein
LPGLYSFWFQAVFLRAPSVHSWGSPNNPSRARHDWPEGIERGAESFAGFDLPVFEPEGLFCASSVAVINDESLHAGEEFEEEALVMLAEGWC